jgi:hypothetical protein
LRLRPARRAPFFREMKKSRENRDNNSEFPLDFHKTICAPDAFAAQCDVNRL